MHLVVGGSFKLDQQPKPNPDPNPKPNPKPHNTKHDQQQQHLNPPKPSKNVTKVARNLQHSFRVRYPKARVMARGKQGYTRLTSWTNEAGFSFWSAGGGCGGVVGVVGGGGRGGGGGGGGGGEWEKVHVKERERLLKEWCGGEEEEEEEEGDGNDPGPGLGQWETGRRTSDGGLGQEASTSSTTVVEQELPTRTSKKSPISFLPNVIIQTLRRTSTPTALRAPHRRTTTGRRSSVAPTTTTTTSTTTTTTTTPSSSKPKPTPTPTPLTPTTPSLKLSTESCHVSTEAVLKRHPQTQDIPTIRKQVMNEWARAEEEEYIKAAHGPGRKKKKAMGLKVECGGDVWKRWAAGL